jgi:L-ascorbate 6-phosphate lactonase
MPRYQFTRNDPYDWEAQIQLVLPQLVPSRAYMESIRAFEVASDGLAIWFLGQNGFILKSAKGPLIGIDLYLTNSCATLFAHLPYRLDRQLPIFIEPEDLDIDFFVTTHSHDDHADPETIHRFATRGRAQFVGPWESVEKYKRCGVTESACRILHPNQSIELPGATRITGAFALPTDNTDLNHIGILISFANGITFYNTGDTAHCELLDSLIPKDVDLCAICINGGFHNLDPLQAACLVRAINPAVAIPCHYDMMINNIGHPDALRTALGLVGSMARMEVLDYYRPWVFRKKQGLGT